MRRLACFCCFHSRNLDLRPPNGGSSRLMAAMAGAESRCDFDGNRTARYLAGRGPPLKWKATGLGKGFSSVSVDDGRIYTMGTTGPSLGGYGGNTNGKGGSQPKKARGSPKGDCTVVALDRGTRARRSGRHPSPPESRIARPRLTVIASMLSAATAIWSVWIPDGKPVWSKNFVKGTSAATMSGWGYSESPLIDGDKLRLHARCPWRDDRRPRQEDRRDDLEGPAPADLGTEGRRRRRRLFIDRHQPRSRGEAIRSTHRSRTGLFSGRRRKVSLELQRYRQPDGRHPDTAHQG